MQSRSFETQNTWRQLIFHPISVLATSLLATLIFAGFIIWRFEGETRWFLLYYFAPIGIPFVTFLFDRAERFVSPSSTKSNQTKGMISTRNPQKIRTPRKKPEIFAKFAPFAPLALEQHARKDSKELEHHIPLNRYPLALWGLDWFVAILSLTRVVVLIPIFSGHALFLSYSMLTMQSTTARITAAVVMLEVAYLKIFVWQDATLLGGIALGCLAALLHQQVNLARMQKQRGNSR